MRLRLLLVADFYPPFIGGTELQTELLAEELAARGHAVWVATVWHSGLLEHEERDGLEIHRLHALATLFPAAFSDPVRRRYHPPLPDPGITIGLRRLIRRLKPDVIDATGWSAYSARLAALGTGVPVVLTARDFGYACPVRTLMLNGRVCDGPGAAKCLRHAAKVYGVRRGAAAAGGVLGLRAWLAGAAAVHGPSRFVAEIERRDLVPARRSDRVTVVPDMVRVDDRNEAGDGGGPLDALPDEPFILFVGALQRHKGIDPLLAAYARLAPQPPLVIVGTSWPDSPREWPPLVTVLADVPNATVQEIWRRALFGVAPSLWPETFGGVITEAMKHGRAIVASALGGPLDIVEDGVTGSLVPPGDVPALAAAMQRLVDEPSLREHMGEAARRRVEALFDTEVVVPQYEAFYASVAARYHDPAR